MNARVTLRAPAKLNLSLEILSRTGNGLHGLRSVMVPVTIFDDIELAPSPSGYRFSCSLPQLEQDNLAEAALRALPVASRDVAVRLIKRIPMQAGLGGGSSDAAAILIAAQQGLFELTSTPNYLATARELGSDVPFFLAQTAALVEGTGERVTPLGHVPRWYAIVVKPPVSISTAEAYRRFDEQPHETRKRSHSIGIRLGEALQRADFDLAIDLLHNDFHDDCAALYPDVRAALTALRDAGAQRPLLSGSGSAVYALMRTEAEQQALLARLELPDGFDVLPCAFCCAQGWRASS
ncbi:MAG: 4-(cytidine 5'-diphospho)-2-C-methyl-D-erythritol kinase [Candidatus Eremiobacteraeota bacterium]|nr:4-(cytidine 5'-diphospho)-2-C-methyl-D-erythritol kinase [Candidatus Eremiobacteraeota bacterium]